MLKHKDWCFLGANGRLNLVWYLNHIHYCLKHFRCGPKCSFNCALSSWMDGLGRIPVVIRDLKSFYRLIFWAVLLLYDRTAEARENRLEVESGKDMLLWAKVWILPTVAWTRTITSVNDVRAVTVKTNVHLAMCMVLMYSLFYLRTGIKYDVIESLWLCSNLILKTWHPVSNVIFLK